MDHDPRIDRLKEILASSYPQVEKESDLAPLPESIVARLHPKASPKTSPLTKLARLFSKPLPALGVLALVTISAILIFRPDPAAINQGSAIRSGGVMENTPRLILINAPEATFEKFKASGYFPPELLKSANSYTPDSSHAIVADWQARTVTRFQSSDKPVVAPLASDDEAALEQILTLYQEILPE